VNPVPGRMVPLLEVPGMAPLLEVSVGSLETLD